VVMAKGSPIDSGAPGGRRIYGTPAPGISRRAVLQAVK
jgi:hypothetical protein